MIGQIVIINENGMWRFRFNYTKDTNTFGRDAYRTFESICQKHNIDLDSYMEHDEVKAKQVKDSITWPKVEFFGGNHNRFQNKILTNVHHLDLNSSYMSGLIAQIPAFKPAVEDLYNRKKQAKNKRIKDHLKACLVMTTGYFQSKYINFSLSHLSKLMIDYNNQKIEELTNKLIASGRVPILYNTDGIWYRGPVYHDSDEGTELGQWKNDHINCTFRAKSAGCYEFEENGQYTAIVRGRCNLDKQCPDRSKWGTFFGGMGTIYQVSIIEIKYDPINKRVLYNDKEEYL